VLRTNIILHEKCMDYEFTVVNIEVNQREPWNKLVEGYLKITKLNLI